MFAGQKKGEREPSEATWAAGRGQSEGARRATHPCFVLHWHVNCASLNLLPHTPYSRTRMARNPSPGWFISLHNCTETLLPNQMGGRQRKNTQVADGFLKTAHPDRQCPTLFEYKCTSLWVGKTSNFIKQLWNLYGGILSPVSIKWKLPPLQEEDNPIYKPQKWHDFKGGLNFIKQENSIASF